MRCLFFYQQSGKTPLHLALEKGHVEVANLLIKSGAKLNGKDKVRTQLRMTVCVFCCCSCFNAQNLAYFWMKTYKSIIN